MIATHVVVVILRIIGRALRHRPSIQNAPGMKCFRGRMEEVLEHVVELPMRSTEEEVWEWEARDVPIRLNALKRGMPV